MEPHLLTILLSLSYTRLPIHHRLDFFNAVLFPMIVLISSVNMFEVDRGQLEINLAVFPIGSFERLARGVIADPAQLELIFRCIKFLRVVSPLDFVVRVGLNVLLCYRTSRLIDLIRHAKFKRGRLYPKRHPIALPFLFYALLTLIFVIVSVNSSKQACEDHPECVIHSRRWVTLNNGELNKCPCIALVDTDNAPKSYDEWLAPRNVSEKVAFLATTGDLEVIHLANRHLDALPKTLKDCKRLRSLYVARSLVTVSYAALYFVSAAHDVLVSAARSCTPTHAASQCG